MRRYNSLITSIVGCITVAFVIFNKTMTESEDLTAKANIRTLTDAQSYLSNFQVHAKNNFVQNYTKHRYVTPSLAELGGLRNIPQMNDHTLMVTRIPRAGAEILVLILQRLQGSNAFKHIRLPTGDDNILTTLQQELLVEDITTIMRREAVPLTFDADIRFLNFSTYGRQAPTFISMVRDPLDPKVLQRHRKNDGIRMMKYYGSIAHFCGQDPRCTRENRTWALKEAKANVERWYPVVGLLEHIEVTLERMEQIFPYFFKGAMDVYAKLQVKNKNKIIGNSTKVVLEKRLFKSPLTEEVEFYTWLKSRLLYLKSENG